MMGFGCNVPAVISTRACSGCSRGTAISAIAFGSACSYQLPATLAVLAAASASTGVSATRMTLVFLAYLLVTTLIYLRLTSPKKSRISAHNRTSSHRRLFGRSFVAMLGDGADDCERDILEAGVATAFKTSLFRDRFLADLGLGWRLGDGMKK